MMPTLPHAAPSSGLQYDELVRVVIGATPPAPGNFQADAAALSSPAAVADTPAPKKHRGFGNLGALAGGLLSGNVAGAVTGAATDAVVGNALDAQADRLASSFGGALAGALRGLTQGRLERHSYYAGWERVDDLAAQTATIRKCDLHQLITLDLAKKTYTVVDPTAVTPSGAAPAPKHEPRSQSLSTPPPEAPGTAVAEFKNVVSPLGPRRLEGLDTTGYDDNVTFAMTQATGSCRNGTFGVRSQIYYSRLAQPRLVCPMAAMPRQRYPDAAQPKQFVASGGCRPTFTAHSSGPVPPAGDLAMYSTVTMSGSSGAQPVPAPSGSPGSFVFLTERGNVHSLTAANSGLFEIPPDYTKAP